MTGTPITNDPMDLIKLINLMKKNDEQIPDTFEDFTQVYLDENRNFTPSSKIKYLNDITGYISYLSREQDARQFAQPHLFYVNNNLTSSDPLIKNEIENLLDQIELTNNKQLRKDLKYELRQRKKQLKNDFSQEGVLTNKCFRRNIKINYESLQEKDPNLADDVKHIVSNKKYTDDLHLIKKWFYDIRDVNTENKIIRVFDKNVLNKNNSNPFTSNAWNKSVLRKFSFVEKANSI